MTLDNVVKTLVFLTDMDSFKAVNAEYAKYFISDPPARSCVEVSALPLGGAVEIEVIARR
jgi:2-iminobutanoate/2-iminopropanoate deaminase